MRILITGASGFVGQGLTRYLLQRGDDVFLLLREAYGMGQPWPPQLAAVRTRVNVVYADLRNFRLTARALEASQPEIIFHLAAAGVSDPFLSVHRALRHNLHGTLNLLRAGFEGRRPPRRCVVARTPGELVALNPYAASKAAAWTFCRLYARTEAWPVVGAMIFQAYGPGQPERTLVPAAMSAALDGVDFPLTSATQKRDWIYITDVVDALAHFVTVELDPGTSLDIGTGKSTSVLDVVEQIYALVGRGGRPLPGVLPDRPGEIPSQIANATAAATLLEWRASIPLAEGLRRFRDSYRV